MRSKTLALLGIMASLSSSLPSPIDEFMPHLATPPARDPKNKFGLSQEEIEAMEPMTPKEKKRFLRNRGKV